MATRSLSVLSGWVARQQRRRDDQAREWYHRCLPGGMPVDWIRDAHEFSTPTTLRLATDAAKLSFLGTLHLTADGEPSDYRDCRLCRARRKKSGGRRLPLLRTEAK